MALEFEALTLGVDGDEPVNEVEAELVDETTAAAEIAAYRAEYEDERTWEALQEDERGMLMPLGARAGPGAGRAGRRAAAATTTTSTQLQQQQQQQQHLHRNQAIRRGVIRSLVIVLDLSAAAASPDMRPTRAAAAASAVSALVRAFFDANQLSSVSIVVTRRGRAERLTELSGSPEAHVAKLAASLECGGEASLQNALDVAVETLSAVPPYSLRECLVFFCGLSSCDPGDVFASVQAAKRARVRVSVIGLAAEVFACSRAAAMTKGRHAVALDAGHVVELAMSHAPAPAVTGADATPSLVRMGFARDLGGGSGGNGGGLGVAAEMGALVARDKKNGSKGPQAFIGAAAALSRGGHECPRCLARVAELPAACHVCGLTLVSSAHLARSYHHLFPVPGFVAVVESGEVGGEAGGGEAGGEKCFGCLSPLLLLSDTRRAAPVDEKGCDLSSPSSFSPSCSRCPQCSRLFCLQCDSLIHSTLHVCPGCEAAVAGSGRA